MKTCHKRDRDHSHMTSDIVLCTYVVGMSCEKLFFMCRIDEFCNIHETFSHFFFQNKAKLRQPNSAETADFRFRISNFEIRQIAFLMTCRPHWGRWLKGNDIKTSRSRVKRVCFDFCKNVRACISMVLYIKTKILKQKKNPGSRVEVAC